MSNLKKILNILQLFMLEVKTCGSLDIALLCLFNCLHTNFRWSFVLLGLMFFCTYTLYRILTGLLGLAGLYAGRISVQLLGTLCPFWILVLHYMHWSMSKWGSLWMYSQKYLSSPPPPPRIKLVGIYASLGSMMLNGIHTDLCSIP